MKIFRKFVSLLLVTVFVMSLMPVVSFAADAFPWTGSNLPAFRGYSAIINSDGTVSLGEKISDTKEDFNMIIDHEPVFGKKEGDTVYKEIKGINTTKESAGQISFASGGSDITINPTVNGKDFVVELALCFENESSVFSTDDGVQYWTAWDGSTKNTWTNFINITAGNVSFAGKNAAYTIVPGRWYNFTFVCDFENTSDGSSESYDYKAYVNGELIIDGDVNVKAYFFRTLRMGSLSYDGDIWLDNINMYNIDDASAFVCPEVKAPVLSSANNDVIVDSESDLISCNADATIADLKDALSIDDNSQEMRYYNFDYSELLSDSDPAVGANLVIAGSRDYNGTLLENTFTYYTIGEYVHSYDGINDGTTVLTPEKAMEGYHRMESVNNGVGGKAEDDYYLLMADSDGASRRQVLITNATGKQDVFEMSVYIPSDSNGISVNIYLTNESGKSKEFPLLIRKDGLYTNFSAGPSKFYELESDKWHNFAFVTPEPYDAEAETNDNTIKIYLNGEHIVSRAVAYAQSGFRNKIFVGSFGNGTATPQAYLDNIRVHSNVYRPEYELCDEISYVDGIQDGIITTKSQLTVAQLKEGITKKDDTEIRVYETAAAGVALGDDAIVKDNSLVVAAAKNGTDMERSYSYYTTGKYVNKYPGINSGDEVMAINKTVEGYARMECVSEGLGGKASDDSYILMADSSGVSRKLLLTNAAGGQDVLEFSVYVPSDSEGVALTINFTNLQSKASSLPLVLKPDGIYTNWSSGLSRFHEWESDRWYNFAFVSPEPYVDSAADNSMACRMYVNGELIDNRDVVYTRTGFRNIITISSWGKTTTEPTMYFDNIRVHSEAYEPQYDLVDSISYVDGISDNNIIVKGDTTVAQLKAGITKNEDTSIRVYESLTSLTELSDNEPVKHGYVVVAAAKNGASMERSYSYYTVDKVKRSIDVKTLVNGTESDIYNANDEISISTSYTNYDEEDHNVSMYTALYKHGKLINIWEDSKTVFSGQTESFACDFAEAESLEGTNVKLMLWNSADSAPYVADTTMRCNNANTEATLYLLGDSIVQTYVDVGYPIQGWGCYIGDYLNDNITVENRATSGWTSDHYLYPDGIYTREDGVDSAGMELTNTGGSIKKVGESNRYKTWSNILSELKEGDYVMVSLGINDSGSGNVPADRYLENMTTIYEQATSKGATVIFSTPTISGRDWDKAGNFGESWGGYGAICNTLAQKNRAVCIPLGAELVKIYNNMVTEYMETNGVSKDIALNYVRNYFHIYAENGTPPAGWDDFGTKTTDDSTHHNVVSSKVVAGVIADLLKESGSSLGDYVIE